MYFPSKHIWRLRGILFSISFGLAGPISSAIAEIEIVGLNDLQFGTWSASGDMRAEDDFCIAAIGTKPVPEPTVDNPIARREFVREGLFALKDAPNVFRLEVRPSGVGQFALQNGAFQLNYRLWFRQGSGTSIELTPNNPQTFPVQSNTLGCAGMNNSRIEIEVAERDLRRVIDGAYSGSLSITVTAE